MRIFTKQLLSSQQSLSWQNFSANIYYSIDNYYYCLSLLFFLFLFHSLQNVFGSHTLFFESVSFLCLCLSVSVCVCLCLSVSVCVCLPVSSLSTLSLSHS